MPDTQTDAFERFFEEQRRHFAMLEGQIERHTAKVDDMSRRLARVEALTEDWVHQRELIVGKIDAMRNDLVAQVTGVRMDLLRADSEIRRIVAEEDQELHRKVDHEVGDLRSVVSELRSRAALIGAGVGALGGFIFTAISGWVKKQIGLP